MNCWHRWAKFLSTLNLSQGYRQVPLGADCIPKTAFITICLEFLRLPFRLMRLIDQVLEGDPAEPYLDDIAVPDQTWEEHLCPLRQTEENQPEEIQMPLWQREVELPWTSSGIRTDTPTRGQSQGHPVPRMKKNMQSFLGIVGYVLSCSHTRLQPALSDHYQIKSRRRCQ